MNASKITKGLLFSASLLFASAAFAGEKGTVKLYDHLKVNGKDLAPGKYEVEWDGTGSNVQVSIRQGKDVIATVPAQVAETKQAAPSNGYSSSKLADGTKTITGFFFAGKKYTLELGQQEVAAPAAAPSNGSN